MEFVETADQVRIAYDDVGRRSAPAILFCNMGSAAISSWEPIVPALAERWRLIFHDRRGDGDSDPGDPESHSFETYRDDALAVVDACGLSKAIVCGIAFGSRVALRVALDRPERVAGLILFDATAGPVAPEVVRSAGRKEAARLRALAGIPSPTIQPAWFRRRDQRGAGLSTRAMSGHPSWLEGLGRIAVPTLLACGEQDPNLDGSRRMAREIPRARLVQMPMTGHGSLVDRPDLVGELIATFVEDLVGTSGVSPDGA